MPASSSARRPIVQYMNRLKRIAVTGRYAASL
jgi:hypothetical protein